MTEINIRVISKPVQFLRFLLSAIVGLVLAFGLVTKGGNSIIFALTFVLGLVVMLWVTKRLPEGNIRLVASAEGVQISWINQVLFKNRPDHIFGWSNIKYYSYIYNRHLSEFKLVLTDDMRHSISFDTAQTDFLDFYLKFKELAIEAGEKDQSVEVYEKDNSLKEGIDGWVLFSSGLAMLLFCAYMAFFNSNGKWLQLVAGMALGLSMAWPKLKLIWMSKNRG